jgi:NADH-quinone oxidoreductase subunit J
MDEAVFIVAAVIIVVGAVGVVASRNPVHSALFLVQTLFGVAVLFVLQDAHFLAAVQVIVYAGAIVILFLFVIMLLGVDRAESLDVEPIAGQRPLAVIIGAAVCGILLAVVVVATDAVTGIAPTDPERALDNGRSDVERLGRVLFTDHGFAFEATAALLTIAVVGAVVLTRRVVGDVAEIGEPASFELPPSAPKTEDH